MAAPDNSTALFDRSTSFAARSPNHQGLAALWPAGLLAVLGLFGLALATLGAGGGQGQFLVIAAPWQGRAQMTDMVWRAGGGVVGFGAWPSLAIAMTDRPDFAGSVRDQGAWFVMPSPILLGCAGRAGGVQR